MLQINQNFYNNFLSTVTNKESSYSKPSYKFHLLLINTLNIHLTLGLGITGSMNEQLRILLHVSCLLANFSRKRA